MDALEMIIVEWEPIDKKQKNNGFRIIGRCIANGLLIRNTKFENKDNR